MSHELRTPPSLPAHDPDPAARHAALGAARDAYQYDFSYADQPFLQKLPPAEHFPPSYIARALEIDLELQANRAASTVAATAEKIVHHHAGDWTDPWRRQFTTLRRPRVLDVWHEDWCFGWQRLAGPCPVVIRRIDALPAWLPVGDAHLARALGREGPSVPEALARGRLYVADYEVFAGLRGGTTDGHARYVWAPVALFVSHAFMGGGLAPVAIQMGGHEGGTQTLVTPGEGDRWMLARTAVQAMDESHQGAITHVGICHMVIQRFIVSARRNLAPAHPVLRLLAPHFENTLAVNQVAKDKVMNPGGMQDRLLAPLLVDQLAILTRSVEAVDLASLDPTVELSRRGVHDPEALPVYPFRDDSLPIFHALRAFVAEYVALYYASDADVAADGELAAFVAEIGAADGGRLPRLVAGVRLATVADAIDLVTRILFRATAFHATINNSNYDWAAFAPNMPCAPFAPFPSPGAAIPADALARMLPSVTLNWELISTTYNVAEIGTNRLGKYAEGHFGDPRVDPVVARFQARLHAIEEETAARNTTRVLPYEYLLPSRITASING
jgi:arachidonate 15-lipoxygenase